VPSRLLHALFPDKSTWRCTALSRRGCWGGCPTSPPPNRLHAPWGLSFELVFTELNHFIGQSKSLTRHYPVHCIGDRVAPSREAFISAPLRVYEDVRTYLHLYIIIYIYIYIYIPQKVFTPKGFWPISFGGSDQSTFADIHRARWHPPSPFSVRRITVWLYLCRHRSKIAPESKYCRRRGQLWCPFVRSVANSNIKVLLSRRAYIWSSWAPPECLWVGPGAPWVVQDGSAIHLSQVITLSLAHQCHLKTLLCWGPARCSHLQICIHISIYTLKITTATTNLSHHP